jgi:uncharacterized protein (DUF2062 family)
VAIGVAVAFTPAIGLHMVIAALLATLCNANRPAAIAVVWINNPLTLLPILATTYSVGALFWPGPPLSDAYHLLEKTLARVTQHDVWQLRKQFGEFTRIGEDVLMPLTIGGILVGLLAGGLSYGGAYLAIRKYRARKHLRLGRDR